MSSLCTIQQNETKRPRDGEKRGTQREVIKRAREQKRRREKKREREKT